MTEKPALTPELVQKIDPILKNSGEEERAGNIDASIALALKAWSMLPEPKTSWDFHPQVMARGLVRKYTAKGEAQQAKVWIAIAHEAYSDPNWDNTFLNMMAGAALLKLDLLDEAYDVFDKVYMKDGREWFGGEYAPCLEFYIRERARRRG